MSTPTISVIMSTGIERLRTLQNTLFSWDRLMSLDCRVTDFTLVLNTDKQDEALKLIPVILGTFQRITNLYIHRHLPVHRIFREYGMKSQGEYVILAFADELLGNYSMLDAMLDVPKTNRYSLNTFFLSQSQTAQLPGLGWLNDPASIENLPDFWSHKEHENLENSNRRDGSLLGHVTGAYREFWDYIGWFREANGYLNYDQDLYLRESYLGRKCYSGFRPCCYHQHHPLAVIPAECRLPSYRYENEQQARLLEIAPMELP